MAQKKVSVRLVAEGGRQVKAEFQGIGDAGENSFKRIERQADVTGAVLRRLAGIVAGALSIRQIVAYADSWTDLRSRVDLATGSQEAGVAVMDRLAAMVRRTYSSLGQTTESWLANATALRELGLSTAESLDFTEALNNAMVVSGARAERAASVQNALSKAMALGTLSGDNLNTVIQSGGRLAELLASELGTTVSGLRGLGQQGAITGDVIRTALIGNLELLREEADSMPATIGDAFTLIGNAALQLVGTWDQVFGASSMVSTALIAVADNMERLAAIGIAFAGFMAARWVAAFVAANAASITLSGALTLLRGAIIRTGIGALIVGAGELIYWFGQAVKGTGSFGEALGLLWDIGKEVFDRFKLGISGVAQSFYATTLSVKAWWADMLLSLSRRLHEWARGSVSVLARIASWLDPTRSYEDFMAQVPSVDEVLEKSTLGDASKEAADRAVAAWGTVRDTFERTTAPLESWQAFSDAVTRGGEDASAALDDANDAADRVTEAFERTGKAGGRAGQEALAGWDAVAKSLSDYADKAQGIGADIGDALVNAFQGAENAVAEFVKTGKLKVSELVTSLIADLARLGARKFIFGPLADVLAGALGNIGGGALAAAIHHAGGMVGGPGPARMVPALAFANAPRLHSGGWAGLRADEVPAILQRGERVLSRREVAVGLGGTGGNVTVNIQARDAESFRQSRTQIAADIARAVAFGRRGM